MKTKNILILIILCLFFNKLSSQNSKQIYEKLVTIKKDLGINNEQAEKSLDSIKPYVESASIDSISGLYYRFKSNVLTNQLKHDSALENLDRSISYYKKARNAKGIALSLMNKGNIYLFQGKTKETLDAYQEALKITIKNNLKYETALLYKNMGILYSNNEKFDESMTYAQKAYSIFKDLRKEQDVAMILINIGNIYYNKYETDKALPFYYQSMAISERLKDESSVAKILNNIGAIYIEEKKDLKKGMDYLLQALEIKKKLNDPNGIILQYNNIASYYQRIGDVTSAEKYLAQALTLAKDSHNKEELKEVYETYSNIYVDTGEYKKALEYYKLYVKTKDSLLNTENSKILDELKVQYETANKDVEISNQRSKILKRNIAVVSLLALLFAALIYYRNYQIKQRFKLQKEILYQQDLATKAVLKAEDSERKRMALHLHDGVGTLLSAINMNINALEDYKDDEKLFNKVLTKTKTILDDAITDVRDLSHQMMPNMLIKNSLSAALRDLIEKTNSPTLKIILSIDGLQDNVDQEIQVVIYRTIQECINNIIKHADARSVYISILQDETKIDISVTDDGKGFDTSERLDKSDGMGLQNVKSRIEYLKGEMQVESKSNEGTAVIVSIPFLN